MMMDCRVEAGHFILHLGTYCGTAEGGMSALYSSLQQSQEQIVPAANMAVNQQMNTAATTLNAQAAASVVAPVRPALVEIDFMGRAEAQIGRSEAAAAAFKQDVPASDPRWMHVEAAHRELELSYLKARNAHTATLQQEYPAGEALEVA